MPGMNINIGSSVFKREAKSMDEVTNILKRNGWSQTGSLGSRVKYFENSGLSVTVVDGPMGTLIIPSGPIRGRMFGNSGLMTNQTSVIGAGADSNSQKENQNQQAGRKLEQHT